MNNLDLKYLFNPRSVAVIGASRHPEKIGYKVLNNILVGGFKEMVYPVNPEGAEILGIKTYKNLKDISDEIDLVLITIPAKFVYEAVKDCVAKKVKFVSIITSGFSEIGNDEEEKKIVKLAVENGIRILGPNVFGLYSAVASLNATFGPQEIPSGNVGILSQSGALGLAMIGKATAENIGLSAIISLGNRTDLDEAELLTYLAEDKNTKVVFLYLEGLKNGEKFLKVVKNFSHKKPIIVVKAGKSTKGAQAAASHTGSIAGSDLLFDQLSKQAGLLRAQNLTEAFNWCKFLVSAPKMKEKNTLIITNGGGIGVMATDACDKYGLSLYGDQEDLKNTFARLLPSFASFKNPVDLTGQASLDDYEKALDSTLNNKKIAAAAVLYCETAGVDERKFLTLIETVYKKFQVAKKPVVFSVFGGKKTNGNFWELKQKNIPIFDEIDEAISSLGALNRFSWLSLINFPVPVSPIRQLADPKTPNILSALKIPSPQSAITHSPAEAVRIAHQIGYPVVLKIASKQILHKTEAGGVFLNLNNRFEITSAYKKILKNAKKYAPQVKIDGIEVSEMLKPGIDVIVGAKKDPVYGPIIMFGLGGIYVEILKEISFRSFPTNKEEISKMIPETKAYPILMGARDGKKRDINAVVEVLLKLGLVIVNNPQIQEIEINPLVVYEKGVSAPDLRVIFLS